MGELGGGIRLPGIAHVEQMVRHACLFVPRGLGRADVQAAVDQRGIDADDVATEALGLGFRLGIVSFGAAIALVAVAMRMGANRVLAFWLAYILTRPLGASLGDFLSQAREYGGLGLGTATTSAAFLTSIVLLVACTTLANRQASVR